MPTLLLIEDNQIIQRVYSAKFTAEGFNVLTVSDGKEAIALALKSKPDVIILDTTLPKISGFDLLQEFQEDPSLNNIPVFMSSNKSWPDDVERALMLGARNFFSKGSTELCDIVAQIRQECGFKKVLIFSPNKDAAGILQTTLQHDKLLCSNITLIAETITGLKNSTPDLIILDGREPTQDCVMVLKQLNGKMTNSEIPIVAITDQPKIFEQTTDQICSQDLSTKLRSIVLEHIGLEVPENATESVS